MQTDVVLLNYVLLGKMFNIVQNLTIQNKKKVLKTFYILLICILDHIILQEYSSTFILGDGNT